MLKGLRTYFIRARLEYHRYMFDYYTSQAGKHINDMYVHLYLTGLSLKHLNKILAYSRRLCNV